MTWWIIACRLDGEDEDTMLTVEAETQERALLEAEEECRSDPEDDERPFYVTAIAKCETEPTVVYQIP